MNLEMLKNPKVWIPSLLFLAALSSVPFWAGEGREDKHGREPHEVAVMFENAYLQLNGAKIQDLATPAYAKELADILDISLTEGSQNNRKISEDWVIEEYRVDRDHYLIHLMYVDDLGRSGNYLRVKRVNDEWRVEYIRPIQFDIEIKGLEPRIIRGGES